jgi:hypothetical protein
MTTRGYHIQNAKRAGKAEVSTTIMGKICAVFGCGTNSCHKTGISTFAFPKEPANIRRAWINFVKTSRKNFSVPTSYNVVCALHFTPCCFQDQFTADLRALSGYSRRGLLNKDAVPTLLTEKCEVAMHRKGGGGAGKSSTTARDVTVLTLNKTPRGKRCMNERF